MHDVPADVLAGPAAVVRPEAPDALPPRPPAAEAAGPAAPADPPLLEGPAGPAVQGDDGAHDDGGEGAEPAAPDDGRPDLPGHVGAAEGGQDVGRHGLQPVVVVQVAAPSALGRPGGGGGKAVGGLARLAVQPVAGGGVARAAAPLLDAHVVHEGHGPRAAARGEEGVVRRGVVRNDRDRGREARTGGGSEERPCGARVAAQRTVVGGGGHWGWRDSPPRFRLPPPPPRPPP